MKKLFKHNEKLFFFSIFFLMNKLSGWWVLDPSQQPPTILTLWDAIKNSLAQTQFKNFSQQILRSPNILNMDELVTGAVYK